MIRMDRKLYIGIGSDLKKRIIVEFHSSLVKAYSGVQVSYQRCKKIFYWPKIRDTLQEKIRKCDPARKEHCKYPRFLQPLKIPERSFTHISIDFIEGLPKSE